MHAQWNIIQLWEKKNRNKASAHQYSFVLFFYCSVRTNNSCLCISLWIQCKHCFDFCNTYVSPSNKEPLNKISVGPNTQCGCQHREHQYRFQTKPCFLFSVRTPLNCTETVAVQRKANSRYHQAQIKLPHCTRIPEWPVSSLNGCRGGGGGGGWFLACEDLGRMFDHLFPACAFFFFFKWRLDRAH